MSDIDGVNSFWIQARAEWESERASLQNEITMLRANLLKTAKFWAEAESERSQLATECLDAQQLLYNQIQYEAAWKAQANEVARLKAAITQMITCLSGDNFRSQQMAHARNVGEKALKGRFGL